MKTAIKNCLTLALAVSVSLAGAQNIRVGLAYDAGGKFDKSFNQSAYEGSQRAKQKLGVQVKDFEPSDPSQVIQGVRSFANEGFDLTIGVGFANNASITQVAKENPDLYFGLVDDISDAKNVASLTFSEQEGSYLVGYLAALNSSTGVVGFVGGMDIPLIHKFEAGYTAGVKAANPKARVIAQYVGTTPDAWNNPGKAKEIAGSMRSKGADIIFAAAGASGNGVIDYVKQTQCIKAGNLPSGVKFVSDNFKNVKKSAAYTKACAGNTRPMFFIGVDSNQNYLGDFDKNPATMNHGLTSMVKRVDNAVYQLIESVKDDKFKGGSRVFGLKDGGVGYAVDQYNKALISSAQVAKVEGIKAQIISGKIKVPSK
ncbi:membrane protein [Deinococcus radiopugnans]|uniref:Membrane protein n=2 Tax=Deinococcus radiopugnans TaxID=57497 RepID=A0A0A7KEB6_9DEIO|nr:BMP family ABC transporter substrate-binding protein [Deinococcus radiopugnans]AIZ44522.1 membrane protein [Deinococcus radiopugnans]MBB6016187.1 basic membrane protein A [Deinococcus radiopugnans ATCC 19172]QLG10143.1 BMP family ABC transporter substrate-binding protein [Deinococcus sp. D7000]TNM72207.1 BMP family ABC transporter substrate-binding protein [Deinococcus radiopugnans ATCC 19172]